MSLATSLYDALTGINIPKDQARDVVEALEHKMTAESATKSDITLVRADIDFLRKDLTAAIESLRKDLTAAIESVRKDMTAAIESVRKDMTAANDSLRKDLMAEIAALRAEMKALEDRLFKKLAALMVTLMGLMFAALTWVGG
jgi:chromosome segregation ATPase